MSDAWDDMKRAKEDQYFDKLNREALKNLNERQPRLSPISGKPMEQVTLGGVQVDRCKESGGIWLDKGELEQILKNHDEESSPNFSHSLLKKLLG